MLWMVKKVFFGEEGEILRKHPERFSDMSLREFLAAGSLIVLVFWMGLFPGTFLRYSEKSLENLIVNKGKYHIKIHVFYGLIQQNFGEDREF